MKEKERKGRHGGKLSKNSLVWRLPFMPSALELVLYCLFHHSPVFLSGEFHGQRSLTGYRPWGCKSQTRLSDKHTHTHRHTQTHTDTHTQTHTHTHTHTPLSNRTKASPQVQKSKTRGREEKRIKIPPTFSRFAPLRTFLKVISLVKMTVGGSVK